MLPTLNAVIILFLLTSHYQSLSQQLKHSPQTLVCHSTIFNTMSLPPPLSPLTVSLKWQLHFQFIIARSKSHTHKNIEDSTHKKPISTATTLQTLNTSLVDTMTWDLPITVLPTVSLHSDERTHNIMKI